MKHPIPKAALDFRLAVVGTSGSGKTYAAMGAVEIVMDAHGRVIIFDPLGVWYGLRLKPDGKAASGYKVVIFGGPHGDLPITEQAGALIGETIGNMAESCIIDLSQFESGAAQRRFMLACLTALYAKTNQEPVHLIFDEADEWAPQKIYDNSGEAMKLLGKMQTIVRRGRVRGFIPWLITQRPAVISKDILSQADGLIAMLLTSSQDRDAIGAWIEGQADKKDGKEILARLPQKQTGEGVLWLPRNGILEDVKFPPKKTFDSSRTPQRGEKKVTASLKPLDIGALTAKLEKITAEIKENDPKELKGQIAQLKKELAVNPKAQVEIKLDESAAKKIKQEGFDEGFHAGAVTAVQELRKGVISGMDVEILRITKDVMPGPGLGYKSVQPRFSNVAPPSSVGKCEQAILNVLGQFNQGRTKNQIAVLSGYSSTSGGFSNSLSKLRSAGLIEGSGTIHITESGKALAVYEELPQREALLQHWVNKLPKCEGMILQFLYRQHPDAMTKAQIGEQTGYSETSGGFNNSLSKLRTLELIDGRGEIKISEDFFQ
jgi:ABC-type oligopeptide transport system ATPase subunit